MDDIIIRDMDFSPEAIAESGQCFRMGSSAEGVYELIAYGKKLQIDGEPGAFRLSCTREEYEDLWKDYFDLSADYEVFRSIIREDDAFLKKAVSFGRGIRILRQEPWEMLISFIISQRKSVPAIRTAVEKLCEAFGEERSFQRRDGSMSIYHAFPTPDALNAADEGRLSSCGLGYRLPYVREAAERAACGELEGLEDLPTEELIDKLMSFKGVGVKVASCVALFGYHRLEVAPVDVWMHRVIDQVYDGRLPEEYESYAGVIQQYLFNYARITKLEK